MLDCPEFKAVVKVSRILRNSLIKRPPLLLTEFILIFLPKQVGADVGEILKLREAVFKIIKLVVQGQELDDVARSCIIFLDFF